VIRTLRMPPRAAVPVQVTEVCLSLVLVKTARGKSRLLDVRRYRLARVSEQFGQRVFEQFAAQSRSKDGAGEKSDEKPADKPADGGESA
jgi:hypothetical protein